MSCYLDDLHRGEFQSTRPLRGATGQSSNASPEVLISIHAPLAGRDIETVITAIDSSAFQSTRPLRGATSRRCCNRQCIRISIHAPLAGRDDDAIREYWQMGDFNPRAPCGARQQHGLAPRGFAGFQSTRPLRGATALRWIRTRDNSAISIHAPLAGRDGCNDKFVTH